MTFATVAVVGAGSMGRGIAQLLLEAGLDVYLHDADADALDAAARVVRERLHRRAERGQWSGDADAAGQRLRPVAALAELAAVELAVDLAIECVPERLEPKLAVFAALDAALPAIAVLASNTSGLDVATLAAATGRPGRVLGLHFYNPPPVMTLVEVVPTAATEPAVVDATRAWLGDLGKTPVTVANRPGFVVNRVLFAMIAEAVRLVDEGVASAAHADLALRLGAGHELGPLALADFIGLDVCLDILESLAARLGERFAPPAGLRALVDAGRLGRKSGAGFFGY